MSDTLCVCVCMYVCVAVCLVGCMYVCGMCVPQLAAKRAQKAELLTKRRQLRRLKACIARLSALEEEFEQERVATERKERKARVRARMREKRRKMQGGKVEEKKKRGPELDEFSVELQARAEKVAGKHAKLELALMLAREEILLAGTCMACAVFRVVCAVLRVCVPGVTPLHGVLRVAYDRQGAPACIAQREQGEAAHAAEGSRGSTPSKACRRSGGGTGEVA